MILKKCWSIQSGKHSAFKKETSAVGFLYAVYCRNETPVYPIEKKKGKRKNMAKEIRDQNMDFLFDAVLTLRSQEECYRFFQDLCTVAEIQEMSRRLLAARMLSENTVYSEIAEKTGLSTATISRVNRCLKYGADGYNTVLNRLSEKDK